MTNSLRSDRSDPRQRIAHIALVVRDYDEAIAFFRDSLGFCLVEDRAMPEQLKRWVLLAPPGNAIGGSSLLLARAAGAEQLDVVGRQGGGRVFLFLATDDFARDYARYRANGVRFVREPVTMDYGTVAVFEDLYGNRWDLIEYRDAADATSPSDLTVDADAAIVVREARESDAAWMTPLTAQLGYPATSERIVQRLRGLPSGEHGVFVALREGRGLGWLHVAATRALEYEPCAEILGIVVDEAVRGHGAGRALVAAAERWAQAQHLDEIRVRSRVTREAAHRFYAALGYEEWKRQVAFRKRLRASTRDG